jgi:CheY-like chemotaxis protein
MPLDRHAVPSIIAEGPEVSEAIAPALRQYFADVVEEPLPALLAALVEKLNAPPNPQARRASMGQARPPRRTALVVEDDAELRWLCATLLEESELDIVECESAEAALAIMLMRGAEVAMVFADIRLPGVMDGVDLAREVKMRWPHLTVVLTSGNPGDRLKQLPPGVLYLPKPWQPLNVLMVAERARLSARRG